jgi:hypothetical protein
MLVGVVVPVAVAVKKNTLDEMEAFHRTKINQAWYQGSYSVYYHHMHPNQRQQHAQDETNWNRKVQHVVMVVVKKDSYCVQSHSQVKLLEGRGH